MPQSVALADLIVPYLLRGENLGVNHAALSVIRVVSYETAADTFGIVIRGRCEFQGRSSIDIQGGRLLVTAANDESTPPFDPDRRAPVFDLRETAIDFELFVPRAGSAIVAQGVASIAAPGFAPTRDVLDVWDALPLDPAPSDFPASGFTLDLVLNAPSLRPPFLHPAEMTPEGLLVPLGPKPGQQRPPEVEIRLPKLRFRLSHGNDPGSRLSFELVSAGVAGLDDPGDIGAAELVSMEPPYAFIGDAGSRTIGFGFRKAVIDLADGYTPPEIVEKFGFGEDWGGLYLPEVRFFVAPEGARDFAFEAGVRDLLIGFGEHAGLSGDFEVALINQGSGAVKVAARFFDAQGRAYGIEEQAPGQARAALPERTRMVVDIQGGRAPYNATVRVGGGATQAGRLFNIDLTAATTLEIRIEVTDSTAGTPIAASLVIEAVRRTAQPALPTPGAQPAPPLAVTLTTTPGAEPRIVIAGQNDREVTLATDPADPNILWSVDGGAETPPQSSVSVAIGPNQTRTVRARLPGSPVPSEVAVYFYFDEPAQVPPADEEAQLGAYAATGDNGWTTPAASRLRADGRQPGGGRPLDRYGPIFRDIVPSHAALTVRGEASYEGTDSKRDYNYALARRRALAVRKLLADAYAGKNFAIAIDPAPRNPQDHPGLAAWTATWKTHGAPGERDWWKAVVALPPGLSRPDRQADGTLNRPPTPPVPPAIEPRDPPAPNPPRAPDWFRSAKLKVRIVQDRLVALEIEGEIDLQTATEEKLRNSGQLGSRNPPDVHTLENGAPLGPDNPADGITKLRLLVQGDDATGRTTTLIQIGADPADKDGLAYAGWMPGIDTMPTNKDFGLTLLGSYISFWPLLADVTEGNKGRVEDAVLTGAALALPGIIAALPWFQIERVILFGGEFLLRERDGAFEAYLLFDVEADWSARIEIGGTLLIEIEREHPLAVRYKAIGLRLANRAEDGTPQFSLRPVFDASRGYTIDVARGGGLKIAEPFARILKILAARISRTNPTTFEVDIGLGIDLGVVAIDRARVRVYLDEARPPELTALAARIDIPGAIAGQGYLEIGPATIGGQIDVTIRPIGLRVAGALEVAQIPESEGGPATGLYVGLNLLLPVGIPLGSSGLGIFGFRGLFGMHYERNPAIGAGSGVPALEWLKAAGGQPHLLANGGVKLWTPKIDRWSFGVGTQLGTMEGGFLLNLDGTLILELPGPRLLIVMNARFLQPLPDIESMGEGGILAVLEITPDHLLIGIFATYKIENLIEIRIPAEAAFDFGDVDKWHFYLGQRSDPIVVDVLGIVRGTGYLMIKGDGLPAYKGLPEIRGFAIGLGAGASFTWGSTDIGLYLRVGGGMDAVVGFDPFILGGIFEVSGELRLFIVSIGAHAKLDVLVREKPGTGMPPDLATRIKGEVCGRVSFFFFDVEGCVSITIGSGDDKPPIPDLVKKLSIKSRSPALAVGSGVDRPIDGSLGDAPESAAQPSAGTVLPVVPIDSIPVLAMASPPVVEADFLGTAIGGSSGVPADGFAPRGAERYKYRLTGVTLERVDPAGPPVIGTGTPARWWTLAEATGDTPAAQLALLTWEPEAAPKAIEKSDVRKEWIRERWGRTCDDAAPPAAVLWTFRLERLGPSASGWELEGVAWPDPPGTRRSLDPDTALDVTERWRSGDPQLDGARGIVPAIVVGAAVPCRRPQRPAKELAELLRVGGRGPASVARVANAGVRLAADDAVLAELVRGDDKRPFRVSARLYEKAGLLAAAQAGPGLDLSLDLAGALARLERGQPIGREALAAALSPVAPVAAPAKPPPFTHVPPGGFGRVADRRCVAKVLQAPIFDDGRLVVFGDPAKEGEIKEALAERGITHGPLDDVVVLHSGPVLQARILLFVRRDLLSGRRVLLRLLDAGGKELRRVAATSADMVPPKALPGSWTDPAGPWAEDVADLFAWHAATPQAAGWLPVLIEAKEEKADRIEIGVIGEGGEGKQPLAPAYYLAAAELLRAGERLRQEWDETEIEKERQVLTELLGPASTQNAFLHPGALYKVSATWTGERASGGTPRSETQSFWFRTDAQPPQRLDPWVLATLPGDGEGEVFGGEPVQIVFATHDVDRLFAAYGKELRIRFQAASAHHPEPKPGVPHPFPINAATLIPAGAAILSPFEDLLAEELAGQCIPIDETRTRQSMVKLPIPLDPYTDYILDILMVDAGAAESEEGQRVYRRHFSTGAYARLSDFAAGLQAVLVGHRAVAAGAMEAIRAAFAGRTPEGPELDEALRAAGLEALPAPDRPRIVVFWQQAGNGPPQPAAVLVDADEPLWRQRPLPTEVADPTALPGTQRWKLVETEWLRLEPSPSGDAVIAADGLIKAPGWQRALIVLAPGSRGKRLTLDLVRPAFPEPYLDLPGERHTVVDVSFAAAPWEEA